MNNDKFSELRRQAEERLNGQHLETLEREDLAKMAHELAVQRIELEIQNEELRDSRAEVEESRDRYLDLFEFALVGYFTLDENGRIVEANLTGCQMLNMERQSLLNRAFSKFISPDQNDNFYFYLKRIRESGCRETKDLALQKSGGNLFEAHIEAIKTGNGRVRLAVVDSTDISELRKAAALKDEFIGMVSHEIKTPLTVVIGALSTVTNSGVSPQDSRLLIQDAVTNADILANIVDNLLELSRSQSERLVLHMEKTDIKSLAETVVGRLRDKSDKHRLIADLPSGLPFPVIDRLRTERILSNLLDNAIKYSPEGGEVTVSIKHEAENLIVCVGDQGLGIAKADQSRLFQKFQRLDVTVKSSIQGIGLGLNVCRILVEAQGGRIWVDSEKGRGSKFCFTIPLGNSPPAADYRGARIS